MSISTIVFDVGRVLFYYIPAQIIDELLPGTPHKALYLDLLFHAQLWQDLDAGTISHAKANAAMTKAVQHDPQKSQDLALLLDRFIYHLDPIQGSHDILMALRSQGYPIYILSNFQQPSFDALASHHPIFQHVDGLVISADIKMMKPEPRIYHHLLDTFSLTPESTLFIDDLPDNIAACEDVGMRGIVFKSPTQLAQDLTKLGISVDLPETVETV